MGINVRTKGQTGEREVAQALNSIVRAVLTARGLPPPPVDPIQRNQNQSAVGGGDLSNTFGLSIEIKRQEALSVNTWWAQCVAAAERNNEIPVLVYRINKGKWQVVLMVELPLWSAPGENKTHTVVRATIGWQEFLQWFYHVVDRKLAAGEAVRV